MVLRTSRSETAAPLLAANCQLQFELPWNRGAMPCVPQAGALRPGGCLMPGTSAVRSRQLCQVVLLCVLVVPFCAASDWNYEETHNDARDFVSGGSVHVRLSVGDVRIRRGEGNKINVRYTVKSRHERNVKESRL